jgi:two-component system response regulator NreC
MNKIKVLIVDDHTLMRSGLRLMLSGQQDIEVVGEASDGHGAVVLAEKNSPDIILLDISMPELNGLECLKVLAAKCPRTKVILLTMHEDARYLKEGFALGAMGYIVKKAADEVLYQAIRAVYAGEMYLQPSMTKALVGEFKERITPENRPVKTLSEQEKKVLSYIAAGYSNLEIAEKMLISVKTVETYKYRIMDKLQCKKRSDLVKFAVETGLNHI